MMTVANQVRQASPKLKWTVPWEWHKQRTRAELRGVLRLVVFTRISLVSLGLALGIWYAVERALGPLDFNWVRAITIAILIGIGVLLVGAAASFVPPTVEVKVKGIAVFAAHGSFMVLFRDTDCISIQESANPVLSFRKETREYRYAIARHIDLTKLRHELERFSGSPIRVEKSRQDVVANGSLPVEY